MCGQHDELLEVVRRVRRRLATIRRNYGRSPAQQTFARLPPGARRPKIYRRPRVELTRRTTPRDRQRWRKYYRRYRRKILSKLKQLRSMSWYRKYQDRIAAFGRAKATRQK